MPAVSRAVSSPFDLNGNQSSSSALVSNEVDQDLFKRGASKVLRALLFTCNTSTYKQILNIMKMGSPSSDYSESNSKPEEQNPTKQHQSQSHSGKDLQTKNIQKITRNDLINGTYNLSPKPIRRSATDPTGHKRRAHHRRRHDRINENGEPVPRRSRSRKSTGSSKSPQASTTPEIRTANIDDDVEQNEMFMSAQDQIKRDHQLTNSKRASESDVSQYHHRHTDDGMLTVPVQRSLTLESDVSDFYSGNESVKK